MATRRAAEPLLQRGGMKLLRGVCVHAGSDPPEGLSSD